MLQLLRRGARWPLVLAVLVLTAACATTRNGDEEGEPRPEGAVLVVTNQAFADFNVYAITDSGQRTRVGFINGSSSRRFPLPDRLVGFGQNVRFLVDPIGSSATAQSFSLYVRPGTEVTLTIPPTVG